MSDIKEIFNQLTKKPNPQENLINKITYILKTQVHIEPNEICLSNNEKEIEINIDSISLQKIRDIEKYTGLTILRIDIGLTKKRNVFDYRVNYCIRITIGENNESQE